MYCKLHYIFKIGKPLESQETYVYLTVFLGYVQANLDTFQESFILIFLNTNQASVHTKPVNLVTETALFWNCSLDSG